MDPSTWARAVAVFEKVCDKPEPISEKELETLCEGDGELVREVKSLLENFQAADSFLERPLADEVVSLFRAGEFADPEAFPSQIGSYRILSRLGRGGMGAVYKAQQENPKRVVALKVLRSGFVERTGLVERFREEHQVLAKMNHPNVAHVYEMGYTEEGRPFFSMAFIEGRDITTYCAEKKSSPQEILQLFLKVCAGVRHAHQKGVIHRDLKPNNILVDEESGEPKIIDFGIAKVLQAEERHRGDTMLGTLLGTPAYMSPEQVSDNDVDTTTDVYALGVLLYQLLTETLPLDQTCYEEKSVLKMLERIRDAEPMRPSLRLHAALAALPESVPERSGLAAKERFLRGDLDWIILKAIEKRKERRYGSVEELVNDIDRLLRHIPVRARKPDSWYLLSKFVRRHKQAVTVASLLCLLVLATLGSLWFGFNRLRKSERRIELVSRMMVLSAMITDPVDSDLDVAFFAAEDHEWSPDQYSAMNKTERIGRLQDVLEERLEDFLQMSDPQDPEVHKLLGHISIASGSLSRVGYLDESERLYRRILGFQEKELGSVDAFTLDSKEKLASLLRRRGRYKEAAALYEEVLHAYEILGDQETSRLLKVKHNYAGCLLDQRRAKTAGPLVLSVMAAREKLYPDDREKILQSRHQYGRLLFLKGEYTQALEQMEWVLVHYRDILGAGDLNVLLAESLTASILTKLSCYEEAVALLETSLPKQYHALGANHKTTLNSLNNLADALLRINRFQEAETYKRQELRTRVLKDDKDPHYRLSQLTMGEIFLEQKRYAEAADTFAEIAAALQAQDSDGYSYLVAVANGFEGLALVGLGRAAQAQVLLQAALSDQKVFEDPEGELFRTAMASL